MTSADMTAKRPGANPDVQDEDARDRPAADD